MKCRKKAAGIAGVAVLGAGLGTGLYLAWPLAGGGPVTGNETFSGQTALTSAQAGNSHFNPTIPLTASGLFSDHGSIYLEPGSGKNGNGPGPASIKLGNGDINVSHAGSDANSQPVRQGSTCTYDVSEKVAYTVTGGTGSYSNVTGGHGIATVTFQFTFPVLPVGHVRTGSEAPACNGNVNPVSGTAVFSATGPVSRSSS